MKKKILIMTVVVSIIMMPLSATAFVSEKAIAEYKQKTIDQNSLTPFEVSIEIEGSGRAYLISTYITNTGDEDETILTDCAPGGGFEIWNQNGEEIYYAPQFVLPMILQLTIEPGETETLFFDLWTGVDNVGIPQPEGTYTVKGYVLTGLEKIYSEPSTINLAKTKTNTVFAFLGHFPLLTRILLRLQ